MRLLGSQDPVVHDLVARTIAVMSPAYPELATDAGRIDATAVVEEAAFLQTLKSGTVARHLPEPASTDEFRKLVLDVRSKIQDRSAVVAVTSLSQDKPIIVAAVDDRARARGIKAGDLVRVASKILKGGGGKPDIAQGGGTDPLAIPDALREIVAAIGQTAGL